MLWKKTLSSCILGNEKDPIEREITKKQEAGTKLKEQELLHSFCENFINFSIFLGVTDVVKLSVDTVIEWILPRYH
jgi:hypothetical protein